MIPGRLNPKNFNRYSYVVSNPVALADPGGRAYCNPQSECRGTGGASWLVRGRAVQYDYLVGSAFEDYPEVGALHDKDYNTVSRVEGALWNYELARRSLFLQSGFKPISRTGMIRDEYFMALMISAEFGSLPSSSPAYKEALEALSNQYRPTIENPGPMQCFGECTLRAQLLWATQMEGLYKNTFGQNAIESGEWSLHLAAASVAASPEKYAYRSSTSWFWGNVSDEQLSQYIVVSKALTYMYPEKPYFIVYSGQIY